MPFLSTLLAAAALCVLRCTRAAAGAPRPSPLLGQPFVPRKSPLGSEMGQIHHQHSFQSKMTKIRTPEKCKPPYPLPRGRKTLSLTTELNPNFARKSTHSPTPARSLGPCRLCVPAAAARGQPVCFRPRSDSQRDSGCRRLSPAGGGTCSDPIATVPSPQPADRDAGAEDEPGNRWCRRPPWGWSGKGRLFQAPSGEGESQEQPAPRDGLSGAGWPAAGLASFSPSACMGKNSRALLTSLPSQQQPNSAGNLWR